MKLIAIFIYLITVGVRIWLWHLDWVTSRLINDPDWPSKYNVRKADFVRFVITLSKTDKYVFDIPNFYMFAAGIAGDILIIYVLITFVKSFKWHRSSAMD